MDSAVVANGTGLSIRILLMLAILSGCSKEARTLAAGQPETAPTGAGDRRIGRYQHNAYQVAQGGRYFTWYGCGTCHGAGASGVLDLGDGHWQQGSGFDQAYAFIAHGHAGKLASYGAQIPSEQLWQITAYVRNLSSVPGDRRQRNDRDQQAEPQGQTWSGAQR